MEALTAALLGGIIGLIIGAVGASIVRRGGDGAEKSLREQAAGYRHERDQALAERDQALQTAAQAQATLQAKEEHFATQLELSEKRQAEASKKILKEIAEETRAADEKERRQREETEEKLRKERQVAFDKEFDNLRKHLKEIEEARAKEGQSFQDQFKQILEQSGAIQKEAGLLTNALRNVKVQGDFGELQLERVLEYSGLKEGIHYTTQDHVQTDDGRLRPDVVVHLTDDSKIIIDSKAPLNAFFAALEADTDEERNRHLVEYAKSVRSHIRTLQSKSYQEHVKDAAPYTVMFLPSEAALLAALEGDAGLLDFAVQQQVLVATSSTVIGLLRAVHLGYQQKDAMEQSQKILALAKDVYERGHRLVESTLKVGKGLKSATDAYNSVVSSYESRFLPKGRELAKFASTAKALPEASEFAEVTPVRDADPEKLTEGKTLLDAGDR